MQKKYGVCKILGDNGFKCYFEYKRTCKKDGFGVHSMIVGRDIITKTPLYSIVSPSYICNLSSAAPEGIIKRGSLLIQDYREMSIDGMLEFLESMTDEQLAEYLYHIEEMKIRHMQAIIDHKEKLKKNRLDEKAKKEDLENKRAKVKSLVREKLNNKNN